MDEVNINNIIAILLGGLMLFLYAIRRLSLTLEEMFSKKAETTLARYTSKTIYSLLLGILVTIIFNSSSVVIIIIIILINSGVLNFKRSMGLIMGANIGTTFSSQIIVLNIGKYAVIPLIVGFFIWVFTKSDNIKKMALVGMYFGFLFFGLFLMEISVHPLKNSELFTTWISQMGNPLKGAAIGGLIALIIQSSSATIGIFIVLAKQQMISLPQAIAGMLGAELGTCSDTTLALIAGKREAIRAGAFQIIFNIIPIILGLFVFENLVDFIEWLFPRSTVARQIANAHVLFSVTSVLLFLPFLKIFYKLIVFMIPDKKIVDVS